MTRTIVGRSFPYECYKKGEMSSMRKRKRKADEEERLKVAGLPNTGTIA